MANITKEPLPIVPVDGNGERIDTSALKFYFADDMTEMNSKVVLRSSDYGAIFGTNQSTASLTLKRLPIVKITANGHPIYREYLQHKLMTSAYAGLTYRSLTLLKDDQGNDPQTLTLEPGCWWMFYWEHPNHTVRMSMRIGVVGISISIVSLILALIALYI